MGAVILATGGFAADFGQDSLLAQHRPDLLHLPTTNGEHTTGDGIKLGQEIGARTLDLEWVQVHPTGLVNPAEPDAKVKFLAAEALRGSGALIINGDGRRFVNELGRRDDTTGEMWKHRPPFRLLLNSGAAQEVNWHCRHYESRGLMRYYRSGSEFASDVGIPLSDLEDTHEAHFQAARNTERDPENGPWNAYPAGRSWDEASGRSGKGKRYFKNTIPGSQVHSEPFYVAIITPVLHYCMGGLEADTNAAVLGTSGLPIPGLWAVGEVMGGVHGNNRLGGNSLLDCVVFGRIAGRDSVRHLLGDIRIQSFAEVFSKERLSDKAAEPSETVAASDEFNLEEVQKHNTKTDCWLVVHNKVYDVSEFLNDHSGGALSILTYAGKDATAEFDMVHPPGVMDKYASHMVVGSLKKSLPLESGERLPVLAWCPCCCRSLKGIEGDRATSWARCDDCAIEVRIRRRQ